MLTLCYAAGYLITKGVQIIGKTTFLTSKGLQLFNPKFLKFVIIFLSEKVITGSHGEDANLVNRNVKIASYIKTK